MENNFKLMVDYVILLLKVFIISTNADNANPNSTLSTVLGIIMCSDEKSNEAQQSIEWREI